MVVTTPVFIQTLINLGPLTTTFTPAPSCATKTDAVSIGIPFPPQDSLVPFGSPPGSCTKPPELGGCVPDGAKMDAQFKDKDPLQFVTTGPEIYYHSPGVACPSGWTTQGAITKQADGKVVNPKGIFTPLPIFNASDPMTRGNNVVPPATALVSALDPGETAAICCPTGGWYMVVGLACMSKLPEDKFPVPTAQCMVVPTDTAGHSSNGGNYIDGKVTTSIIVDGVTHTSAVLLTPTYSGKGTVTEMAWQPGQTDKLAMITVVPGVVLVHKAQDAGLAGNSSSTGTNAAVAMRPGGPDPRSLGGLALVVATAIMAGVAVMMPW